MIGLGTAPLAFQDVSPEQGVATVHAALDSGIRFIDTALAYTRPGVESYAEALVATAVAHRSGVTVATKGGHRRDGDDFPVDGRPASLRADCETSLRTLGVDRIDLYQLHHVDPRVPLTDSVGALLELREAGKIAAIGLSNVDATQLGEARAVAPIASVQNRLSLFDQADLSFARRCGELGLTYLAYQPLTGPAVPSATFVAARHGVSVPQIWLAWLLAQGTHVVPLVGSTRPETIRDSAAATAVQLDDDDLRRLER